MFYSIVKPEVDISTRRLCTKPYPGHPGGCPNFASTHRLCPPYRPILAEILDATKPIYAVWNIFNIGAHAARLKEKFPTWSERQLYCCLYWQPKARKELAEKIKLFNICVPGQTIVPIPEATGVNITETMANIGEMLEWPPRDKAYQVVLAGTPNPAKEEK